MASLEGLDRFLTEHVEGPLLLSFGFQVSFAFILFLCLVRGVECGYRHWLEYRGAETGSPTHTTASEQRLVHLNVDRDAVASY